MLCLALVAGCGADAERPGSGDPQPSTFQVLRAIAGKLLANSVEARPEADEEEGEEARTPERSKPRLAKAPPPPAFEAEVPQTCEVPYNGPVTIIRAQTPTVLARAVSGKRRARLVYETDDTAIWDDGHVVTTDVENLGTHLNAVGWAANPMRIAGAGTRPGASTRNLGWGSGTSSFKNSNTTKRRKRRRG